MKFKMAENSLFATLLRSPWWVSLTLAVAVGAAAAALVPANYRLAGALSGFPFAVIAAMSAWSRRGQPGAAQVEHTSQALGALNWAAFAPLLEQAFLRDGFTVKRCASGPFDFDLERQGRRMLVAARRWKSAHTGLEPLRALQAARDAADAPDALYIALGEFSAPARQLAASERIAVWQAAELAQKLRGLLPPA
jgi:restriction system protein